MRRVWAGRLARELYPLVEFTYARCRDLEDQWRSPDVARSVSIAQILSGLLGTPGDDGALVAVCRRDAGVAPDMTAWSIGVVSGGRVGVVSPAGVFESAGDHVGLISQPREGRYSEFLFLPGVHYPGGRRG